MKILIISSGNLPITGDHGGAIENLINIYLKHNEIINDEIVVYSAKIGKEKYDKQIYNNTKFRIIDRTKLIYKIKNKIIIKLHKKFSLCLNNYYIKRIVNDIIKKKEEAKYDIIIFENGQENIKYFRKKIKTKTKIVLHLHNDYLNCDTKNGIDIYNLVDEVWAVSNYIKSKVDEIANRYNLKVKTKVLYNTIDYEKFSRIIDKFEKKQLKDSLNIKEDDFVYIYVGRIMDLKGTLELVNAFTNLNKRISNIKLLVVGGNVSLKNNDQYINKVKKQSNENVIFTGQINNKEIYKYYQISNVQIVPSKYKEAFGLILLEGVASNLPIIASNIGGISEIMEEKGIYVNPDNLTNELEKKMEDIFYKRVQTDIKIFYEEIKNKFSKEKYCEKFNKYMRNDDNE